MTSYKFGDVVLVPFPFTDQTASKKRPAIVVSSAAYHKEHADIILIAVSSQISASPRAGEVTVVEWKKAGLLYPSMVKPVLTTVEKSLVLRTLGKLSSLDRGALEVALRSILG